MNRIALMKNCLSFEHPSIDDFKLYDTQVLINGMFTMFVLKEDKKIEMLHLYQIDDIAKMNQIQLNLADILCNFINDIPNTCWTKVSQLLKFASN